MKVDVKTLKAGKALDFLVAQIFGKLPASGDDWSQRWPHYSTNWAHGGPVFEREIANHEKRSSYFYCNKFGTAESRWPEGSAVWSYGDTLLESAMRTIVIFYLGELVEVYDELLEAPL